MKVKPDKDVLEIMNLYIVENFIDYEDYDSVYTIIEKGYIDGVLAVFKNGKSHSRDRNKQQEVKDSVL